MSEYTVGCSDIISITFTAIPCWDAIDAAAYIALTFLAIAIAGTLWTNFCDWRSRRRMETP